MEALNSTKEDGPCAEEVQGAVGDFWPVPRLQTKKLCVGAHSVVLVQPCDEDEVLNMYIARGEKERDPYWCCLWPSAITMFQFVLANPEIVKGKRVCDLGAGLGSTGIAAMLAGAKEVVFLDREPLALLCAILSCHLNCPGPLASNLQAVLADCGLADFSRQLELLLEDQGSNPGLDSGKESSTDVTNCGGSATATTPATSATGGGPDGRAPASGVTFGPSEEAKRSAALAELVMCRLVEGYSGQKDVAGAAEGQGLGEKEVKGGDQGDDLAGAQPGLPLSTSTSTLSLNGSPPLSLSSSSSSLLDPSEVVATSSEEGNPQEEEDGDEEEEEGEGEEGKGEGEGGEEEEQVQLYHCSLLVQSDVSGTDQDTWRAVEGPAGPQVERAPSEGPTVSTEVQALGVQSQGIQSQGVQAAGGEAGGGEVGGVTRAVGIDFDWSKGLGTGCPPFDVVLASDVLYELSTAALLADLLPTLVDKSGMAEGVPCAVVTDPTSRCPSHRKLFLHLIAGKERPPATRGLRTGASVTGKPSPAPAPATTTAPATNSEKSSEFAGDNSSGSTSGEGTRALPADKAPTDAGLATAVAPPMQLQEECMYRVSWREDGAFRKSYIECILLGARK